MCGINKTRVGYRVGFLRSAKIGKKRKNPATIEITGFNAGAPRGIRTHNLLIRREGRALFVVPFRDFLRCRQSLIFQWFSGSLSLFVPFRDFAILGAFFCARVGYVWDKITPCG